MSSCDGKHRFANRKAARRGRRATPTDVRMNIYHCERCGWYHLGHMPSDVRQGLADKDVWLRRTGARP